MKKLGNLPWTRIPTHLPFDPDFWRISPMARCVILGAFCIAGASGGMDTGMDLDDLGWALRETDDGILSEAMASGYLEYTSNRTVAISNWEEPAAVKSAAEQPQQQRPLANPASSPGIAACWRLANLV